jgi:hypothetical protein
VTPTTPATTFAPIRLLNADAQSPIHMRAGFTHYPHYLEEAVVDDKQLAKLIRKNVAKVEKAAKAKTTRKYDPTLAATRGTNEEDGDVEVERTQFFKEMKRREF